MSVCVYVYLSVHLYVVARDETKLLFRIFFTCFVCIDIHIFNLCAHTQKKGKIICAHTQEVGAQKKKI